MAFVLYGTLEAVLIRFDCLIVEKQTSAACYRDQMLSSDSITRGLHQYHS